MPDEQLCIVTTARGQIGAITAVTTIDLGDGELDTAEARLHRWRNGERDVTIARLRSAAAELSQFADELSSAGAATT